MALAEAPNNRTIQFSETQSAEPSESHHVCPSMESSLELANYGSLDTRGQLEMDRKNSTGDPWC